MPDDKPWETTQLSNGVQSINLSTWLKFQDAVIDMQMYNYIWRGQANNEWILEPSLERLLKMIGKENEPKIRNKHLDNFLLSIRGRRGNNPCMYEKEDDWWALGQHHGLKTPLLDWTTSPFVALFFAFLETSTSSERVVYALNPISVEEVNQRLSYNAQLRIIRPWSNENSRLVNQGGLFTRGPDGVDVESWLRTNVPPDHQYIVLRKIHIPNRDQEDILRSLNRMNINYLTLLPDLLGACLHSNISLFIKSY